MVLYHTMILSYHEPYVSSECSNRGNIFSHAAETHATR